MLSSLGIIARILNSLGGSARILNGLGANARIDACGKITDPELKRFAQQFGYNRKNCVKRPLKVYRGPLQV